MYNKENPTDNTVLYMQSHLRNTFRKYHMQHLYSFMITKSSSKHGDIECKIYKCLVSFCKFFRRHRTCSIMSIAFITVHAVKLIIVAKTCCVVDLSLMTTIFILLLLKIIFFTKYRHMGVQEVKKITTSTHCCIHPHVEFCTS